MNDGIDPKFNHNVSPKIQEMFDELSKLYEMEW